MTPQRRRPLKTLGLTGSIGMGKSTVSKMFADEGAAVWDADAAVHRLYAEGGAGVAPVGAAFPEAIVDQAVDRDRLSRAVLGDATRLKTLEAIVHPLVAADRMQFIEEARESGARLVVLDVPLLFEVNAQALFDAVAVVSAPAAAQRARVLARPGMTEEKFAAILAKQLPDAEKRRRADYVIDTGLSFETTRETVRAVMAALLTD